jgi:hypothetical protein
MSFRYFDDFENMNSPWAHDGMRQAAVDCVSGQLPSHARPAIYLRLIQEHCWRSLRPSAWVRGYLLIALKTNRLDLKTADYVCRTLMQPHWEIDHFPRNWIRRAMREPKLWISPLLGALAMRYPTPDVQQIHLQLWEVV